jgi:DNA-binding NarL/FixJ family response regulator
VRVAAYVPDLMDRSRISAAVADVVFVKTAAELADHDADVVVLDAARPGALDVVPSLRGRIVAFGSHVDTDLLAAARDAGVDDVLPRSVFFRRLPEVLS